MYFTVGAKKNKKIARLCQFLILPDILFSKQPFYFLPVSLTWDVGYIQISENNLVHQRLRLLTYLRTLRDCRVP